MAGNKVNQNLALIFLIVWFGVPFVLQQDLWPALRMGMFAESTPMVTEHWTVTANGKLIESECLGFSKSNFQFLCRNAYYKGQAAALLKDLSSANNSGPSTKLILTRSFRDSNTIVSQYPN